MDFSQIQPASSSEIQSLHINDAKDLLMVYDHQANAGDQVEMFLSLAETQPDKALGLFATVLGKTKNLPKKALALQGFGHLTDSYKVSLASGMSSESQELLKILCSELKNKTNDLTIWAATEAIQGIGFPSHLLEHSEGGDLSESPRRIKKEVLERNLQQLHKIQRLDSKGEFTAEYERFLEFWIYGPTEELLKSEAIYGQALDIVKDVLFFTQTRGAYLGLVISQNPEIQQVSFEQLQSILTQYKSSKDTFFKKNLEDSLSRFFNSSDQTVDDLRKLSDAALYQENDILSIDFQNSNQSELYTFAQFLKRKNESISSIFTMATKVCSVSTLSKILQNIEASYQDEIVKSITGVQQQLDILETESRKFNDNIGGLNKAFSQFKKERLPSTEIESQSQKFAKWQNVVIFDCSSYSYSQYQSKKEDLNNFKEDFTKKVQQIISDLYSSSQKLNVNFDTVLENARNLIIWGVIILICTFAFSSCTGSFGSRSNNVTAKQGTSTTASTKQWYEKNYPKNSCGTPKAPSAGECWNPVFISYTNSNWSEIINTCKDVPKAQSQSRARQRGKIQIASFNSESDAKGFAKFMDQHYSGTPWIGETKCY
ncbi:hypothetical protein [[Limnothrix rosea] IAM M-220]|uniref:hypothetical protein n=1 Tax=[Limnothrix rosea] IAM M-220 TaxID=454133 RepID=UPI00095D9399|nr:hypothetical protein [[Limnothrix rosea] IAM M-220]OKH19807.1 hypothetical protein NIES208_01400 [[Limnothrix rosea] IAM M-220]